VEYILIVVKILFATSGMKGFKYLFIIILLQIWYKFVSFKQHFLMKHFPRSYITYMTQAPEFLG